MTPVAGRARGQVGGLLRFVLTRTFVEPVREGRLRSRGWPPGLRAFAVVAVVVYGVLALAAVLAGVVRRTTPVVFAAPDQSLPTLAVPLVGVGATLTLACLAAAALHVRVALRVPLLVVVGAVLLAPVDWSRPGPLDLLTAALVALLLVLALLRAGRSFHWGEPVACVAIVGGTVVVQQVLALAALREVAPGVTITALSQLTNPLWALAAPVSILAGAALVEVTTSAATWTTVGFWSRAAGRPRTRSWTAAALVVLVAVRVVQEVRRVTDPTDPVPVDRLLLAALVVAVVAAGCAAACALADRTMAGDERVRPDPDDLLPAWRRCAPVLALVLGATIGLQLVVSVVLRSAGLRGAGAAVLAAGGSAGVVVAAAVGSAGTLVAAAVLSLRGHRRAGVVLVATGLMYAFQTAFSVLGLLTTTDDVLATATAAAVVLLVGLAVSRRLTAGAEVSVAGVLLLTAVYPYRDLLDEPFTALVSLSGVSAALLVGLVWRLLTDNAFARGGTPGLPQASRVLLALANALVGVTSVALVALLGGRSALDFRQTESLGDGVLGFPLVLAVVFAALTLAARGREVGPSSPAPGDPDEGSGQGVGVAAPGPEPAG